MKIRLFILIALLLPANCIYAQEKTCKVNDPNLSGTYTGDCKKGYAHGKGIAQGVDYYEGQFSKGMPSGKGIYKWADGTTYEGQFLNGLKDGKGKMIYKDSTITGYWKADKYVGEELIPEYKVNRSENIARSSFKKSHSALPAIRIKIMQAGVDDTSIDDFSIATSTGSEYRSGGVYGIQNPSFPADVKLRYRTWNKLHTAQLYVVFDFTITEPGLWDVTISN